MKKNKYLKIFIIIIILMILGYYLYTFIKQENNLYELYNDYTRADTVMTLTYNKNFQFYTTRNIQMYNFDKKLSEGDLIYDFADYDFIPIFHYLHSSVDNDSLISEFNTFLTFLSDFNYLTIGSRENILVKQKNGKYYIYDNGVYKYYVKVNVIGKDTLNNIYKEYLTYNKYRTVEENFISNLLTIDLIKKEYSYQDIINEINNNYDNFYKRNKSEVVNVIIKDLNKFNKYLYDNYININNINGNTTIELLKNIDTEPLELTFNFRKFDKIYSSVDKHYSYIYKLDINDVWEQLAEKGYPKIYS